MYSTEPRIIFYSLEGKKVELFSNASEEKLDTSKEIKTSKNFNEALKLVIKKDINLLTTRLENIIKEIVKHLAINGTVLDKKLSSDIKSIDNTINDIEALISDLIIKKENIKIGLFSANKKDKKNKINKLANSINYLSKCHFDIISISNEYTKLVQRNNSLESLEIDSEEEQTIEDSDPLERTINFYMTKEEIN